MNLDKLAALAKAATPGPWRARWDHLNVDIKSASSSFFILEGSNDLSGDRMRDASFIAAFRNHAEALIEVVRAARNLSSLINPCAGSPEEKTLAPLIDALAKVEAVK